MCAAELKHLCPHWHLQELAAGDRDQTRAGDMVCRQSQSALNHWDKRPPTLFKHGRHLISPFHHSASHPYRMET